MHLEEVLRLTFKGLLVIACFTLENLCSISDSALKE